MTGAIDPRLVEVALEHCRPDSFERFGQAMLAALLGVDLVPAGGMHDGGVDAFEEPLLESGSSAESFFQISKELAHRRKIRKTLTRLHNSGRNPRQVTLLSSNTVSDIDLAEERLSRELGLIIRIRDRKWVAANINSSLAVQSAFAANLAPDIAFLREFGGTKIASTLGEGTARTAYVFLSQEVERRRGDTQLLEAVTDSLILWALEGTDPNGGLMRSRAEITTRILDVFPSARQFLRGILDNRLERLGSKQAGGGREIRWYRKPDKFCLPFETRQLVEKENLEDEALRLRVRDIFRARAEEYSRRTGIAVPCAVAADLANRAIEFVFEAQGLDAAAFLTEAEPPQTQLSVADQIDKAIVTTSLAGDAAAEMKEAVLDILRGAFYRSSESERDYFGKLSRTYALFLSLKTEPRIVEYFRTMSGRFSLYVGSDILVLALSEHFLPEQDRMVCNMLKVVKEAGSTLILCESVLEEVLGHFRASDGEHRAVFESIDQYITRDLIRHAERILVRSYYYARLEAEPGQVVPRTWHGYVDLFLTYAALQRPQGLTDLRRYLCDKFGLVYEAREDMQQGVSERQLQGLTERLAGSKQGDRAEQRAQNDALMALCIYAKRRRNGEMGGGNPYGYTTWWLTKESRIRAETAELVRREHARFMMIPEFLLNFIALAPSARDVRHAFEHVFPSRLGIRLSNRMREDVFKDVIRKAKEASDVDPERLRAKVAELSDQLKGDRFKRYEQEVKARH